MGQRRNQPGPEQEDAKRDRNFFIGVILWGLMVFGILYLIAHFCHHKPRHDIRPQSSIVATP